MNERATSRRPAERLAEGLLRACAGLTLLVGGALAIVFAQGVWSFMAGGGVQIANGAGVAPLLAGTALTAGIALAVAAPLGVLAAIYLSELAAPRVRAALRPALEVLAGVPTLVYGFLALELVTPLLQGVMPGLAPYNALAPGVVIGVMITPLVAALAEDAFRAVPPALREAALALGADRLATFRQVVLPPALPGVVAALLLALARAVGETMVVALAAGAEPRLTLDPRVPVETLSGYLVHAGRDGAAAPPIFAAGAVLLLCALSLGAAGRFVQRRVRSGA